MAKASTTSARSTVAASELAATAEYAMANRVAAARYETRDAIAEVDALEGQIANRRSLRASQETRLTQAVSAARIEAANVTGNAGQQMQRAMNLEAAEQRLASQQMRNDLLNESDVRSMVAARGQLNAVKRIETEQTAAAESAAIDARYTEQTAAFAKERERIGKQEAADRIQSHQRMMGAITSGGTMAVMAGATLVVAAGAMAGALSYAADKAANFEKQLLLIKTQAGATRGEVDLMRDATLSLAPQFGYTATQAATAAFHIESVGLRGKAAVDALKYAMEGARIGAADLEATTNMLAVIMASGVVPAGQSAARTMATLDAIIGQGNIRMDQLAAAFKTGLVGAMQLAGIHLRDMGAALATLTDLGYTGATAGTALRSALTMISAPTNKATELLKIMGFSVEASTGALSKMRKGLLDAGINVTQFAAEVRSHGLEAGLQMLHDKMKAGGLTAEEMAATITKAFGGSRIGSAFKTLFENMGRLDMREKAIALNATPEIFAKKWADTQALTTTRMAILESSFNRIVILFGEAFLPTFNRAIDAVGRFMTPIGDWIQQNQGLLTSLMPLIIAMTGIAGAVLIVVGGMAVLGVAAAAITSAIGLISGGALLAIGVFAAIGVAFATTVAVGIKVWGALHEFWDSRVGPAATRLWNSIMSIWTAIQNGIKITKPLFDAAFKSFSDTLTAHGGLWDDATKAFENFSKTIVTWIKSGQFATLVADFAVGLPAALSVSLDMIILFGDQVEGTFTTLSGVVKLSVDLWNGDLKQATIDASTTGQAMVAIQNRTATDILKLATDTSNGFNGTNQKMWQQVYDSTMAMTAKIGNDGAIAIQTEGQKLQAANLKIGVKLKPAAYRNFFDVGTSMSDGMTDGVTQGTGSLVGAVMAMVAKAHAAAKKHAKTGSPSMLFYEDIGVPIGQGIIEGIKSTSSTLVAAMQTLLTSASTVSVKPSAFNPANILKQQEASAKLMLGLASSLGVQLPAVMRQMWTAIYTQSIEATVKLGTDVDQALIRGFKQWAAAPSQTAQLVAANFKASMLAIGASAAEGMINGLGQQEAPSRSAITKFLAGITTTAQAIIKSSPSKLMADEVGSPMGRGIIAGLQATASALNGALSIMLSEASQAARIRPNDLGGAAAFLEQQSQARATLKLATDTAGRYLVITKQMWQDVYVQTIDATHKLGLDGAGKLIDSFAKWGLAHQKAAIDMATAIALEMRRVGVSAGEGLVEGLISQVANIRTQFAKVAVDASQSAKRAIRASSPSLLFAEDVGVPMAQGIILGVQMTGGALNAAIGSMVAGAALNVVKPTAAGTGAHGGPDAVLDTLKQIRDGVLTLVADLAQANGATTQASPPQQAPATNSTLSAAVYSVLQEVEANRRRGIKSYGAGN